MLVETGTDDANDMHTWLVSVIWVGRDQHMRVWFKARWSVGRIENENEKQQQSAACSCMGVFNVWKRDMRHEKMSSHI